MKMNAPLQLENYFYSHIQVDANPSYEPGDLLETNNVELKFHFEKREHSEDSNRVQLLLKAEIVSNEESNLSYIISFEVVGYFEIDPEFEHDNLDKVILVNGFTILYSAARELILTITGRGPWDAFQIPTVSFLDILSEEKEVEDPEKTN